MILDKSNPKVHIWNAVYSWTKKQIKNFSNAVDIGCKEGGFARELEDDFQHIYCFDFRDKKNSFSYNVKDTSKFTYTVCGLGEKNGTTFTSSKRVGRIKDWGPLEVPIRTLDSFEYIDIGFIKIDVEGYEYKVLLGSEITIKKYKPVILIEQNRGDLEAVELLKKWNYRCVGIDKIQNHDYLMVPDESS